MSTATERETVRRLRAIGAVFAEDEARLLHAQATSPEALEHLLERRLAGLPLEHVLGWVEFDGLRILVDERVFVPRQRTRVMVRQAVALGGRVVVDLCCGSAAVGVAIAATLKDIELHAADIDPVAVANARRNVEPIDGFVWQGDLFEALPATLHGRVDLLVVNAPYVPTEVIALMPPEARLHEELVALDGGADGLDVQRRVATGAADWLSAGGHILIETSEFQAPDTETLLRAAGFQATVVRDENLDGTVVIGRA